MEDLEAKVLLLETQKAALETAITDKTTENTALKTELAAVKQSKGSVTIAAEKSAPVVVPTETFTVKGKKYRFVLAAFWHKGVKVVASELLSNDDALAQIVADYPSVVEAV